MKKNFSDDIFLKLDNLFKIKYYSKLMTLEKNYLIPKFDLTFQVFLK